MILSFGHPLAAGAFSDLPRGRSNCAAFEANWRQLLPTDTIGVTVLTLNNLVVGSAIQIETVAGVALAFRVAAGATESFTLDAYSVGAAQNNLRIKVRKGSATPFYQPYETQVTISAGSQSVFISQTPDE